MKNLRMRIVVFSAALAAGVAGVTTSSPAGAGAGPAIVVNLSPSQSYQELHNLAARSCSQTPSTPGYGAEETRYYRVSVRVNANLSAGQAPVPAWPTARAQVCGTSTG